MMHMADNQFLPEPLPDDPMPLFASWFAEARTRALQPNPDAMVLATVGADSAPSARIVLCKRLVETAGYAVFFTNNHSRKGRELVAHPRAAAVFHWDAMQRQVRIEGPVVRSPARESDEYFASRALASRVGAWASDQSQPLGSRAQLQAQVTAAEQKLGISHDANVGQVPRPPYWGGTRLWIDVIELWVEGPGRIHDRAQWRRELRPRNEHEFDGGQWEGTRLNP
jgi:pyridoxamine 5'-phosphate oxidase